MLPKLAVLARFHEVVVHRVVRVPVLVVISCAILGLIGASPAFATSPAVIVGHAPTTSIPTSGLDYNVTNLAVPSGTWWITATATLAQTAGGNVAGYFTSCTISGGTDGDTSQWAMTANDGGRSVASLFLTFVHTSSSQWNAALDCINDGPEPVSISNIRISALKGSLSSSGSPRLARVSHDASADQPGNGQFQTLATLNLPAGRWWIVGKTNLVNTTSGATNTPNCQIAFGTTDIDQTKVGLYYPPQQGTEDEVAVQLGHVFASSGSAKLQCKANSDFSSDHVRIVAFKAGKLTRREFGGSSSSSGTGTPTIVTGYYEKTKASAWLSIPNSSSYTTVGSLALPAGKWYISAKLQLQDGVAALVECRLITAGSDMDGAASRGGPTGFAGTYLQVGHAFASAGSARLQCRADDTGVKTSYIRITAVSASGLSRPLLTV
jgi:hypothetical protein